MSKKPLCRYCEQPMKIDEVYYNQIDYCCDCDGYKKESSLRKEIACLEHNRVEKIVELSKHMSTIAFRRKKSKLEQAIREVDNRYEKEEKI